MLLALLTACVRPTPTDASTPEPTAPGETAVPTDDCATPRCSLFDTGAAPLQLVHGPQGGWHVDVPVHTHATGRTVFLRPELRGPDGTLLGQTSGDGYLRALAAEGTCGGTTTIRAFLDTALFELPTICALDGEQATVTVTVEELDEGGSITCSHQGRVLLDPYDEAPCQAL